MRSFVASFVGLSFAAGCVDAISFLGFGVFTANMTGNAVLLGIALAGRLGGAHIMIGVFSSLNAIVTFTAGVIAANPVFKTGFDSRRAAIVVAGEAVLIAVAAGIFAHAPASGAAVQTCIALASIAMGAQSLVAAKAGLPGISTTYITGTLVTAVMRGLSSGGDPVRRSEAKHDMYSWVAYFVGAFAGALLVMFLRTYALWVAAALLLLLAINVDRATRPIPR